MAVNVETLDKLERRISLSLPADEINKEVETRLKKLSRTVKADGFRPGKVPMSVVAQRYGYQVQYEVMNDKLGNAFNAAANEVTFGPVIAKDIGRTTHTVNLFFTQQLGPDQTSHGLDFNFAWQSRWNLWAPLSPAIEIYGDTGTLGRFPGFSQQQLLIGPVAVGVLKLNQLGLGHAGSLKYELGWLFGATQATASGTLRWRLEVEIPF